MFCQHCEYTMVYVPGVGWVHADTHEAACVVVVKPSRFFG